MAAAPESARAAGPGQGNGNALRDAVVSLAAGASVEVTVKNVAEVDAFAAFVKPGTSLYLPWLPGQPQAHLVEVAGALKRAGFQPVPHIAARRLPDWETAEELVSGLARNAGVSEVLVIGGDVDRPGAFDSAAAFIESGLLQRYGIRRIGVAGYPEGHPRIGDAELAAALERKVAIAKASGLDLHVVSQFCFDGGTILRWIGRLASRGIRLPVRVGLAGPAKLRTLINYGVRCGVGPSLRALRTHGLSLARLVSETGPEQVVRDLAAGMGAAPLAMKLHLFSFGGVERTARWIDKVAGGRFELEGAGLRLTP